MNQHELLKWKNNSLKLKENWGENLPLSFGILGYLLNRYVILAIITRKYCTMAHFCLGICANDLQVPSRHEEAILLFLGCLG